MRTLYLLFMLIPGSVALCQGPPKNIQDVYPGDTVQVATSGLQTTDTIAVNLTATSEEPAGPATPGSARKPLCPNIGPIAVEGPSQTAFSFAVPPDACLGLYQVAVAVTKQATTQDHYAFSSPHYLRVSERPPTVTGISPSVLFRGEAPSATGAGAVPTDSVGYVVFLGPPSTLKADGNYTIRFSGHSLPKCGTENSQPPQDGRSCYQQGSSEDGQIRFLLRGKDFLSEFSGKQSVSLIHNGAESATKELTVVDASRTTPRNYALAVTLALVALIWLLIRARGTKQTGNGRGSFLMKALFLDEATQTYSLSKCQFYAWTLAGVLGYVFFAVAKSVIQGSAVFPEVPGNLPAVLLVSAGTSVAATGITSAKGNKGAGGIRPTLADFVTMGNVVAPERLQFVVWTVVGIFTFLTIVFKSDPLTLSELPKIPDGFLALMGISSTAYAAGKVVRKPGPVVKVLSVAKVDYKDTDPTKAVLTLNLKGDNLDPKAKIKVDGKPLRGDLFEIPNPQPDPQTGFCSELNVILKEAADYLEGPHTLTVVNGDAQAADVGFPIDPMSIEKVQVPATAPAANDVVVTGKNFVAATFEWKDADGKGMTDSGWKGNAVVTSPTTLTVSRAGEVKPGFTLTLISSPVGLRASAKIKPGP